jgi:glycosyltransferase involved in cell wall biosynthesis
MKIGYATDFNVLNALQKVSQRPVEMGHWGRCYYTAKALTDESTTIQYLGPLAKRSALMPKLKWRFYKYLSTRTYYPWAEPVFNQYSAQQILEKLEEFSSDLVVSVDINLLSYLQCRQPSVLWVDTLYAGLINFYDDYSSLCGETIRQLHQLDQLALSQCELAIFSSDWAAKTAIHTYKTNPNKVKVIPSGANVECDRTFDQINSIIAARPANLCKLLFLGVDWFRKGGDIAFKIAAQLNQSGLNTELTIAGCKPKLEEANSSFVKSRGFIDKSSESGVKQINQLIAESHFLVLLSRAETYGNVLCEANSFGVPCISTCVGGIPTIIKDGVNGKLFPVDAEIEEYCTYVSNLFSNYNQYQELALSAFNEYETRLNWAIAGQTAKKLFQEIL